MSQQTRVENNSMTPYLDKFLEWSEAMNYSQDTTKTRNVCVRRFITWCDERDIGSPQDVTKPVLESYRRHLFNYRKVDGQPLSFTTQHSHLSPIKAFFKWLNKENYILFNPASDFELPRIPKRLPRHIFSYDEIDAMLAHTAIYGDIGIRDRAIMDTFYSSGVRKKEVQQLKLRDIDLERGTLFVDGKGKKDRVVPLGDRACEWVQHYLEKVRPTLLRGEDSQHVFLSEVGEAFNKNQLSDLVKKYMRAVGIDKPGACHLFRHSMATHMLENGADIRYIQVILGHVNLSTTEIYTQVSIKKLKQVHAATHPARN